MDTRGSGLEIQLAELPPFTNRRLTNSPYGLDKVGLPG